MKIVVFPGTAPKVFQKPQPQGPSKAIVPQSLVDSKCLHVGVGSVWSVGSCWGCWELWDVWKAFAKLPES
eukprot:9862518-Lingulodinium_polyedra.AAC.1